MLLCKALKLLTSQHFACRLDDTIHVGKISDLCALRSRVRQQAPGTMDSMLTSFNLLVISLVLPTHLRLAYAPISRC
jgi:hypothetical protein